MIKILFYIPNIDQTHGGVRQYAMNLLETVASFDKASFQFYVYHNVQDSQILAIVERSDNCTLTTDNDIYTLKLQRKNYWRTKGMLLSQFFSGKQPFRFKSINGLDVFIKEKKINFLHVPYQYLPQTNTSVKILTTLHDVQELHFPAFFNAANRAYRASMYLNCVLKSHKILVSYKHVAQDLLNFFDADPQKIQVCLLNMKDLWFNKFNQEFKEKVPSNPYDVPYILYPANFWKHKNHKRLIKAFSIFKKTSNSEIKLVLTGNSENEEGREAMMLTEEIGIKESVIFAGILDENQLYATYKNALGVVVPTLYEAGSFPLMESLIMEIPVICSNVTSLPETIGDDQFVFDPFNIDDIADKIAQLVLNKSYQEKSILNSKIMSVRIKETGAEMVIKKLYLES